MIDLHPPRREPLPASESVDHDIPAGAYFGLTDRLQQKPLGLWFFDGTAARRLGVVQRDNRTWFEVQPGETFRSAVSRWSEPLGFFAAIHRMSLAPGAYHPRIARPNDQHPDQSPGYSQDAFDSAHEMTASLSQIRSLVGMLDAVFQTVHPVEANLDCYGSNIRNLIILASTECEAQWKGVLVANGYKRKGGGSLTRLDYSKLEAPMKLSSYSIAFACYPWLGDISPFEGWKSTDQSIQALPWYDDYNAVKHDRERKFQEARLRSAIEAVAGCWVMIAAQYGFDGTREFDDLSRYFRLSSVPSWRYSDVYCHPYDPDLALRAGPVEFFQR